MNTILHRKISKSTNNKIIWNTSIDKHVVKGNNEKKYRDYHTDDREVELIFSNKNFSLQRNIKENENTKVYSVRRRNDFRDYIFKNINLEIVFVGIKNLTY